MRRRVARRAGGAIRVRLSGGWTFAPHTSTASPASPPARAGRRSPTRPPTPRRSCAQARACDADGVAVAVFPELCLSGYSIEDLLLQDALLDGVEEALAAVVAGSAELLPVLVVGAPLRHRGRVFNCAVVIHRGRVLGVVPKSYLPTYREFYERRQIAAGDERARRGHGSAAPTSPSAPTCCSPPRTCPASCCTSRSARTSGCRSRRARRRRWPARPCSLNLSGSPITVGRAEDRKLLCRSQSSRCLAAYVYAAAGEGESTTDLSWDGQTMIYENGVLLAETDRFPDGDRRSVADVDLDLLRQERMRMGTFDDNRRDPRRARSAASGRVAFTLAPPGGDLGLRRQLERFPFVPADAERLEQDCYEAYNIQVAGLAAAARGDRRPEGRDRRLRRPRLDAGADRRRQGDGPGRPAAHRHPRLHAAGLRDQRRDRRRNAHELMRSLGVTAAELDITETARLMLREIDHPFARGEEVYDVTFENVQAGLRTDYLFRIANQRGGIVLGTGDLSELALGWATYGVGDQMSHYNVNGGVPKTLIQHLIRWVVSSGQFDARRRRDARARSSRPRSAPSSSPARSCSRPSRRSAPTRCTTSRSSTSLRYGFRPTKIGFLAWHAWRDADGGRLAAELPRRRSASPTTRRRSAAGSRSSASASSPSPSSSARRCRTGRRSRTAARSRRAATGARRPTAPQPPGCATSSAGRSGTASRAEPAPPPARPAIRPLRPRPRRRPAAC